jgi:CheY-like chemotaxis protein
MANILVIDDVEYVRNSILRILTKEGHTVHLATNGREGLELLKSNPVDLLILDVVMPEMGGVEMLMKLKTQYPDLKTVFITGHIPKNSAAFNTLSITYGARKTLFKPFKAEELIRMVNEVLTSSN